MMVFQSLAAEAEEKKEGEAALNEMFQKIYADANDDVSFITGCLAKNMKNGEKTHQIASFMVINSFKKSANS